MADPQKADLAAVRLKTLAMIRDFDGVLAPLRVLLYAIEVALDSAKNGSDAVRQAICVYVCVCAGNLIVESSNPVCQEHVDSIKLLNSRPVICTIGCQ